MRPKTKEKIEHHFGRIKADIFWPSDLAKILDANRATWGAPSVTAPKMADALVDAKLVKERFLGSLHSDSGRKLPRRRSR
jgi:hypothetical protein